MTLQGTRACVIGAGITGSLTALELAKKGCDVTVLEAKKVGAGSSSRTAGGIRQQWETPSTVVGMRFAVDYYRDLQKQTGSHVITQNGYLFLVNEAARDAAQRRVAMQQHLGLDVELLDRANLKEIFPYIDVNSNSHVVGGTWCPSDGFLHPEAVYNDAIALAQQLGVQVFTDAPVESATHDHRGLNSVHTPKGKFEADFFIDATNTWTPQLAQILGAKVLAVEARKRYLWTMQRDTATIADAALTPKLLERMPLTIAPESGLYWKPESRVNLMFAQIDRANDQPDPEINHAAQDTIPPRWMHNNAWDDDSPVMRAWAELATLVPDSGFSPRSTASGYYGVTPDHNPYLDFDPQVANLIRLVGFSGHGAMFGPFTAQVAVALAAAGRSLTEFKLPNGMPISLAAFLIGREIAHGGGEKMVI